jgi:hypothetical protein
VFPGTTAFAGPRTLAGLRPMLAGQARAGTVTPQRPARLAQPVLLAPPRPSIRSTAVLTLPS